MFHLRVLRTISSVFLIDLLSKSWPSTQNADNGGTVYSSIFAAKVKHARDIISIAQSCPSYIDNNIQHIT